MNAASGAIWLQAQPSAFDPSFFLMIGTIFMIFYFLVLRPENQKRRAHEDSLKAVARGDTVTTTGGIQGKVTGATDEVLTVEIAKLKSGEAVRIKVKRSAVQSLDEKADEQKLGKKGADS